MATIIEKIAAIRGAVFGKDVRESIAQGIEAINTEVESTTSRQTDVEADMVIIDGVANRADAVTSHLAGMMNYSPVAAVGNIFTLDLSANYNFSIETEDTNAKNIAFSNVPETLNVTLIATVKVKYTNIATITYPAGVLWQDGVVPYMNAGKQYLLMFISYDNGASWLGSYIGEW